MSGHPPPTVVECCNSNYPNGIYYRNNNTNLITCTLIQKSANPRVQHHGKAATKYEGVMQFKIDCLFENNYLLTQFN